MVVWSAWGAQSCLALDEEYGVGYSPPLQLPEPWGHTGSEMVPGLRMAHPQASKGVGVTH